MALSTASRLLKRLGPKSARASSRPQPANRYERKRPGELVQVDVKKLGRIADAGHHTTGERACQNANCTAHLAAGTVAGASRQG
jgi:hypothetical protein